MSLYDEFWAGVEACRRGEQCPEDATEAFQRGFGMEQASANTHPPIELDKFEQQFQEIFG